MVSDINRDRGESTRQQRKSRLRLRIECSRRARWKIHHPAADNISWHYNSKWTEMRFSSWDPPDIRSKYNNLAVLAKCRSHRHLSSLAHLARLIYSANLTSLLRNSRVRPLCTLDETFNHEQCRVPSVGKRSRVAGVYEILRRERRVCNTF